MDILNLKYNKELMKTKSRLEKELKMISEEIEKSQESCNHIKVCLGWNGPYQYRDTSIHLCLLCRDYDPDTKYKTVDATNYKKLQYSHGEFERDREERLLELQELTMNMMMENPSTTEEEIVEKLNEIIQEDVRKNNELEKKLRIKTI